MTIGTATIDLRIYNAATPPVTGVFQTGPFFKKTWSGTDYPSAKPQYTNVFSHIRQPYYHEGRLVVPAHTVYRKVWVKPPKRVRSVDHAYTVTGSRVTSGVRLSSRASTAGTYASQSVYLLPIFPISTWSANDDIMLLGKLREQIAGSDFNAGVMLGEGRKSLSMIGDSAVRIAKALRSIKKGRLSQAANILTGRNTGYKDVVRYHPGFGHHHPRGRRAPSNDERVLSGRWLELQYGWLPLLSDVDSGARFLAHNLNTPLQFRVAVSRNAGGAKSPTRIKLANGSGAWQVGTYTNSKKIVAHILERDVAQLSGLMDPLSIAWELVPYSFVVDWFIPVGNFLQARGLVNGITGRFVTTTIERTRYTGPYLPRTNMSFYSGGGVTHNGAFRQASQWKFVRSVSTNLSVPLPHVKPLGSVPSWKRAANSVALLLQRT